MIRIHLIYLLLLSIGNAHSSVLGEIQSASPVPALSANTNQLVPVFTAGLDPDGVLWGVLMSSQAVCDQQWSYAPAQVFLNRYGFKVCRVAATPITTQVVNREALWYFTAGKNEGQPMWRHGFAPECHPLAIPTVVQGMPLPTICLSSYALTANVFDGHYDCLGAPLVHVSDMITN